MATGRVKGITTRARTSFLPRNSCSRRKARLVPSRLFSTAATTKKTTLLRNATQKLSISSAALKFSSPMKPAICSPTVASLTAR